MTVTTPDSLKPEQLRRACDATALKFKTTAELEPLREAIGQDLAMRAVRFGLEVEHPGYNIFAIGLPGSGRATIIRQLLEDRAREEPTPSDWCYVYNFSKAREPYAVALPPGRGPELRTDVEALLEELQESLPKALQTEEVRKERDAIAERVSHIQRQLIEAFQKEVEAERYVALVQTPTGWVVAPALGNEPLDEKQFQQLSEEQREEILDRRREMEKKFADVQLKVRETERDARRLLIELQQMVAEAEVESCVKE